MLGSTFDHGSFPIGGNSLQQDCSPAHLPWPVTEELRPPCHLAENVGHFFLMNLDILPLGTCTRVLESELCLFFLCNVVYADFPRILVKGFAVKYCSH